MSKFVVCRSFDDYSWQNEFTDVEVATRYYNERLTEYGLRYLSLSDDNGILLKTDLTPPKRKHA